MAAARRGSGLSLCRPFTSRSIVDPELARTYLLWLMETTRTGRRRTPMMVVVPAGSSPTTVAMWRDLGDSVGARSMVVERPVAAVAGLGLETDAGIAHLVVDAEVDGTEVAVVVDGRVVASRQVPPISSAMAAVVAAIRDLLVTIDPDYEIDIADMGIHLLGREVKDPRLAEVLAQSVGFPVAMADNPESVVIEGARRTMEAIRPYLSMVTTRSPRTARRLGFRGARGAV